MKRVVFHPMAEAELDASSDFYELREQGLGVDFEIEVGAGLHSVRMSPTRWPPDRNGARSLLLDRFPFRIVYLDQPESIWIVAVAHCSRRPGYWRKRLH